MGSKETATHKEVRTFKVNMVEHRDDNGNVSPVIEGYALTFGQESKDLGYYTSVYEVIDARALDYADMSECVCLFNHDSNQVLGRNGVNLSLTVDEKGLFFRCTPSDTSYARDLITNMKAGVLNECSFAFTIADEGDAWTESQERNAYIRTITKIDMLYDVSVVTNPAYKGTSAQARSIPAHLIAQPSESNVDLYKRKLDLLTL